MGCRTNQQEKQGGRDVLTKQVGRPPGPVDGCVFAPGRLRPDPGAHGHPRDQHRGRNGRGRKGGQDGGGRGHPCGGKRGGGHRYPCARADQAAPATDLARDEEPRHLHGHHRRRRAGNHGPGLDVRHRQFLDLEQHLRGPGLVRPRAHRPLHPRLGYRVGSERGRRPVGLSNSGGRPVPRGWPAGAPRRGLYDPPRHASGPHRWSPLDDLRSVLWPRTVDGIDPGLCPGLSGEGS